MFFYFNTTSNGITRLNQLTLILLNLDSIEALYPPAWPRPPCGCMCFTTPCPCLPMDHPLCRYQIG